MILAAVPDLLFRSRIGEVARLRGIEVRFVRDPETLANEAASATLLLLDLDAEALRPVETIAEVRKRAPEVRILGFLSHVNRELRERAVQAGCSETQSRGEFTRQLPEILAPSFVRVRGFIEVCGRDRVKWLQGLVTAELTTLVPGGGCLAAACSRQGKMVGVMVVRVFEDRLLLEIEPELVAPLRAHFERFLIMEDVALSDRIQPVREVFASQGGLPRLPWFHFVERDGAVHSANRSLGSEGWTIFPATASSTLSEAEYESRRIANGWPRWGVDMGTDELPMEAGLDPAAISYSKGCYLGQEVILRVKTYSEPPKRLVLLALEGKVERGASVTVAGEAIGNVTSVAESVALATVRKQYRSPGTRVEVAGIPATVRELPWHAYAERPPDKPQAETGRI